MLPGDFQAVWVALLAIVPGYIATSVWARTKTWKGSTGDLRTVLVSLAMSMVVQVLVAPVTRAWIYPVRGSLEDYQERVAVWFLLVVLVIPLAGGLLVGRLTDYVGDPAASRVHGRIRRAAARVWPASAPPSIWDWLFTARPPFRAFLVVEFDDGSRVAGVFAEDSMALTSPEPQGLFLISEWVLDENGDISRPIPDSAGIMVMSSANVRWVRVLSGGDDERQGQPQEGSSPRTGEGSSRSPQAGK